jgi:hypothetical protein
MTSLGSEIFVQPLLSTLPKGHDRLTQANSGLNKFFRLFTVFLHKNE